MLESTHLIRLELCQVDREKQSTGQSSREHRGQRWAPAWAKVGKSHLFLTPKKQCPELQEEGQSLGGRIGRAGPELVAAAWEELRIFLK